MGFGQEERSRFGFPLPWSRRNFWFDSADRAVPGIMPRALL